MENAPVTELVNDLELFTLTKRVMDEKLDKIMHTGGELTDFVDARVREIIQSITAYIRTELDTIVLRIKQKMLIT